MLKFVSAMDRCFNVRHRSSNYVPARKTLTTAPTKFAQRLITAQAKQRWSSVQNFCVFQAFTNFLLAVPNFGFAVLCGGELYRNGYLTLYHCSQYFVQLKPFGALGGTISGDRAYTAFP